MFMVSIRWSDSPPKQNYRSYRNILEKYTLCKTHILIFQNVPVLQSAACLFCTGQPFQLPFSSSDLLRSPIIPHRRGRKWSPFPYAPSHSIALSHSMAVAACLPSPRLGPKGLPGQGLVGSVLGGGKKHFGVRLGQITHSDSFQLCNPGRIL